MVSSEFIWIAFSKSVLLIDVQGFEKFEKEVLSIPNVDKKIMELKEFIEYIDKNRTLSYEEKEEEKKFKKLLSIEAEDSRIQAEREAKQGYDNTYKKIYQYIDKNRTLSYETKEEEKKFEKLISKEYEDSRIQPKGYDNTYKKIYFYMLAKDIVELNNLIKEIK